MTTHSPYLLDLLDLSHIVVVERVDGEPVFSRPDKEQLREWSKSFAQGDFIPWAACQGFMMPRVGILVECGPDGLEVHVCRKICTPPATYRGSSSPLSQAFPGQ